MSARRNVFLDHGFSDDDSDQDDGYDSEAAEALKGAKPAVSESRGMKRRKLSHSEDDKKELEQTLLSSQDSDSENSGSDREGEEDVADEESEQIPQPISQASHDSEDRDANDIQEHDYKIKFAATLIYGSKQSDSKDKPGTLTSKSKKKTSTPGVIYLSSLPPYLKPSALRNILTQRGFHPISRLFLAPTSKAKTTSKKNSRQLYGEGWIEFASRKTARRCAETLNATIVGGRKGGFYHDDLWNMKYLKGMGWDELMAGVREERREAEGRRDEERRVIARETKRFVEGVEEGRRIEGMKRKRRAKGGDEADVVKRTWNQYGVKDDRGGSKEKVSTDVQSVLSKIF